MIRRVNYYTIAIAYFATASINTFLIWNRGESGVAFERYAVQVQRNIPMLFLGYLMVFHLVRRLWRNFLWQFFRDELGANHDPFDLLFWCEAFTLLGYMCSLGLTLGVSFGGWLFDLDVNHAFATVRSDSLVASGWVAFSLFVASVFAQKIFRAELEQ